MTRPLLLRIACHSKIGGNTSNHELLQPLYGSVSSNAKCRFYWTATRPLRHNGQPYSGINVLSLWMSAEAQGFAAPIWMTYRQAVELNAQVRKGEKA